MPCSHFTMPDGTWGIVTYADPSMILTDATGRDWPFEFHNYFGPSVVSKRTGDPLKHQPGERSPFWHAIQCWLDQGKEVADGRAVWIEPPPLRVRRLGGNHVEDAGSLPYEGSAKRKIVWEAPDAE